jgi:pyridoxal phosphate enzyme (YggS family)
VGIRENLACIIKNIEYAAARSGRSARDIKLIAVTKGVSADKMKQALAAGISAFGENRVQEMMAKQPYLPTGIEWHFLGHLQTNKVKYIINRVNLIHSLDSIGLARTISRLAVKDNKIAEVLAQVNIAGEKTKFGLAPGEVIDFIRVVSDMPGLKVRGLMAIAPLAHDTRMIRPFFREMRRLFEQVPKFVPLEGFDLLSMGMSNDYIVAVEEGANILRVGTAIFEE